MDWSNKFLNNLGICLRKNSHIRIPIIVNTINVTQASTQTLPINFNNNNIEDRHKTRRRKYQHRFNKCLAELIEKYPPIPAHEYLKENKEINSSIWLKLLESREDLSKLNKTLEDLDKYLSKYRF